MAQTQVRILREFSMRWMGPPCLMMAGASWVVLATYPEFWWRIAIFLAVGLTGLYFMFSRNCHRLWVEGNQLCWSQGERDHMTENRVNIPEINKVEIVRYRQDRQLKCDISLVTYSEDKISLPPELKLCSGTHIAIDDVVSVLRKQNPRIRVETRAEKQSVEFKAFT